ncbi:MAG: di-trans,poly-cis-decaprenylcistransferase [Blastocatellia bacterium]|nr:di-trans,poly-cis-decaprenylcistransferase [Blastocatellia bacterium]
MIQSSLHIHLADKKQSEVSSGLHVAIIMDGNGRWATARGKARIFGHRAGADSVRRVVEAAPSLGITTLTLYAFSSDNWKRPTAEVTALMRLLRLYLRTETEKCIKNGVRISVIGRRDRLAPHLVAAIERTEKATAPGITLHLRIAIDYSSRDSILRAAMAATATPHLCRETFSELLTEFGHGGSPAPDVDLLIRTGGEHRLSDFLLWESAYAELFFTKRMWPDFGVDDLAAAVDEFRARERRFGAVPTAMVV